MLHWHFSLSSDIAVETMARLSNIALIVAVNVLVLMCILAEEERYTDKYDNVDYRTALNNKTVRDSYYDCFMEIAPCQTPTQIALTSNIYIQFFFFGVGFFDLHNIDFSVKEKLPLNDMTNVCQHEQISYIHDIRNYTY